MNKNHWMLLDDQDNIGYILNLERPYQNDCLLGSNSEENPIYMFKTFKEAVKAAKTRNWGIYCEGGSYIYQCVAQDEFSEDQKSQMLKCRDILVVNGPFESDLYMTDEDADVLEGNGDCYLIARFVNQRGCIATRVKSGKELASLVDYLSRKTSGTGVEILTVSSRDAWGEYAPYHVCTESEFIANVFKMIE